MPKRIQQRRTKGWRMPAGARSVARPGPFGNPFRAGMELTGKGEMPALRLDDSAAVVAVYRLWLWLPEQADLRDRIVRELRGQDLACFCPLENPCHADPILELANGPLAVNSPLALAERIVDDIMSDGQPGRQAERLVMEYPHRRFGGGWGRGPLIDRIEKLIADQCP